ncbi:MAG: hypothetical protein WCC60_05090 [Ilumatobacteraceae bacterium]
MPNPPARPAARLVDPRRFPTEIAAPVFLCVIWTHSGSDAAARSQEYELVGASVIEALAWAHEHSGDHGCFTLHLVVPARESDDTLLVWLAGDDPSRP